MRRFIWLLMTLLLVAGCVPRSAAPVVKELLPAGSAGPGGLAGPSTADPSTAGPSTAGPSTAGPSTAGPSTAGPAPVAEIPPQITLLFVGDIMLARIPGEFAAQGQDPFAGFADLLTGADLTVGNLECVIATVGQEVPKAYNFRCHPDSVALLARYFDAVSVANNHSGDYGKEAFAEQLDLLTRGGVPYFGGGRNLYEAHRPLLLERNGLKVALLAYNEVEFRSYEAGPSTPGLAWSDTEAVVRDIRAAKAEADLVVVYPHWGLEYHTQPSARQTELAQAMIDAGADLVVGAHPHVTQPVEIYQDRLIAYSLGNYVFDDFMDVSAELNEPSRTSWVLQVTLSASGLVDWKTVPARTDDRGFPQPITGTRSPCAGESPTVVSFCNH